MKETGYIGIYLPEEYDYYDINLVNRNAIKTDRSCAELSSRCTMLQNTKQDKVRLAKGSILKVGDDESLVQAVNGTDYLTQEMGTFTPNLRGIEPSGLYSTFEYDIPQSNYIKIGNFVNCNFEIFIKGMNNTQTQTIFLEGLPFCPKFIFQTDAIISRFYNRDSKKVQNNIKSIDPYEKETIKLNLFADNKTASYYFSSQYLANEYDVNCKLKGSIKFII